MPTVKIVYTRESSALKSLVFNHNFGKEELFKSGISSKILLHPFHGIKIIFWASEYSEDQVLFAEVNKFGKVALEFQSTLSNYHEHFAVRP